MAAHMMPIRVAFVIFFISSFLLLIPWLIYSYRKYNYLSIWQTIAVYSFFFYSLCAVFLVILPLPLTRDTCAMQPADTVHFVLIPFTFIKTILADGAVVLSMPSTYINFFKHSAFFEVFFNALLLFPLGVYLRYFFEKRQFWKKSLVIIFSTSLFFEITQLTGIYGIYNCAYRLFDTNDLVFNTLGGMVGFFLGSVLLVVFPKRRDVLEKGQRLAGNITHMQVLLSLVVDIAVIQLLSFIATSIFGDNLFIELFVMAVLAVVVFFILPLVWDGKTIGGALLRFRLVPVEGQNKSRAYLKRTIAIGLPFAYMFIVKFFNLVDISFESEYYVYFVWTTVILTLGYFIMWLVFIVHLFVAKYKGHAFYFDRVAKIKLEKVEKK